MNNLDMKELIKLLEDYRNWMNPHLPQDEKAIKLINELTPMIREELKKGKQL